MRRWCVHACCHARVLSPHFATHSCCPRHALALALVLVLVLALHVCVVCMRVPALAPASCPFFQRSTTTARRRARLRAPQVTRRRAAIAHVDGEGQTTSDKSVATCVQAVMGCLKALTPIASIDHHRSQIQDAAETEIPGSSHLGQFVDAVHKQLVQDLELSEDHFKDAIVQVTDATSAAGRECTTVVTMVATKEFHVETLVTVVFETNHHLNGLQGVTPLLISCKRVVVEPTAIIASAADRVSANDKMAAELDRIDEELGTGVFKAWCFGHTGNDAGKQMVTPFADQLAQAVAEMTGKSNVAVAAFKAVDPDNRKPVKPSGVRWWNDWASPRAHTCAHARCAHWHIATWVFS